MNDGKVEISLSEYNEFKSRLSELENENLELKGNLNRVEIILKRSYFDGRIIYDRWKNCNIFKGEEVYIDEIVYTNFEEVEENYKHQLKEEFKEELNSKELNIKNLLNKIELDKQDREDSENELKEKFNNLKKKYEDFLKDEDRNKLKEDIIKLKHTISSYKNSLKKKKEEIINLEKTNAALYKRLPFWKKI